MENINDEDFEVMPFVIHSGWLQKKGQAGYYLVNNWKKRFFQLYSNGKVEYYGAPDQDKKGEIVLSEITEIKWFKNEGGLFAASGQKFNLYTPKRVWELWGESVADVSDWLKYIALTKNNEIINIEDKKKIEYTDAKEHYAWPTGQYLPTLNVPQDEQPAKKSPRSAPKPLPKPKSPREPPVYQLYLCEDPEKRTMKTLHDRKMQTTAFIGWINYQLRDKGITITDINQMGDGSIIIYLVDSLVGTAPPNVILPVTNARDKMHNTETALEHYQNKKNVQINYSSHSLINQSFKPLMDLIWDIIYNEIVLPINYASLKGRFGLFRWLQDQILDKGLTVTDFSSSFKDGMVICALVSNKGLIDFETMQPFKAAENMKIAFEAVEENLGIPQLLNPNDIANISSDPDEISIIVWLSMLFNA